jgi:DNA-directed RNA polymerase subunit M/transcription elongation factor TFIIS
MNAMTAAIYIPPGEELRDENIGVPLAPPVKLPAERAKALLSLHTLFSTILSNTEIQELERCIYNATILAAEQRFIAKTWTFLPFVDLYKMTVKSMAANFHPDSYVKNTELYQRYKDGQVGFAEMISMNSYQLFEGRWRDSFVAQQAREKRQLEGNKAMATDRFYCTRCHKRECTYYEMQTRSADEPMTIFITCINCGKHWRQ